LGSDPGMLQNACFSDLTPRSLQNAYFSDLTPGDQT
jgi:hypothetical protein